MDHHELCATEFLLLFLLFTISIFQIYLIIIYIGIERVNNQDTSFPVCILLFYSISHQIIS